MSRGCHALLTEIRAANKKGPSKPDQSESSKDLIGLPLHNPAETFHAIGRILQRAMGGTSGALYGVFFIRFAAKLRSLLASQSSDSCIKALESSDWAAALQAGTEGISAIGGAKVCYSSLKAAKRR